MKEKSLQEKNAAERQVELITSALGDAADSKGYWLNAEVLSQRRFGEPIQCACNGLERRPERL